MPVSLHKAEEATPDVHVVGHRPCLLLCCLRYYEYCPKWLIVSSVTDDRMSQGPFSFLGLWRKWTMYYERTATLSFHGKKFRFHSPEPINALSGPRTFDFFVSSPIHWICVLIFSWLH